MRTGQMNRKSVAGTVAIVLMLILALGLLAGCGGQDEAEEPAPETSRAMVPGAGDSITTDPAAPATGAQAEPLGTSGTGGVQNAEVMPGETLQALKPAETRTTAAEVKNSTQAPQVVESDGTFSLQLGSFRSVENARAEAARITALGYTPTLEVASLGGQTYHRIVLRGLADRNEAERLGENIRSQLGITYLIRQK